MYALQQQACQAQLTSCVAAGELREKCVCAQLPPASPVFLSPPTCDNPGTGTVLNPFARRVVVMPLSPGPHVSRCISLPDPGGSTHTYTHTHTHTHNHKRACCASSPSHSHSSSRILPSRPAARSSLSRIWSPGTPLTSSPLEKTPQSEPMTRPSQRTGAPM